MDKFTFTSQRVYDTYLAKGIVLKPVNETAGLVAWYVDQHEARRANTIFEGIKPIVHRNKCIPGIRHGLPHGGAIIAVADKKITDQDYRAAVTESRRLYGELSRKLDSITMECGTSCVADNQTMQEPQTLAGVFKTRKRSKKKEPKEKIQEALDGLATPDDIQPEESLRALFKAMKDSGLLKNLPKSGIKWHIPPSRHSITFLRDKVPVLQLNLTDLNDEKTLTQTLLSLEAMAGGEAPQANEVTAEYIKQLAARVRDKERQLSQLASKYAPKTVVNQQLQQQQQMQQLGKPTKSSSI